MLLDFSLTDFSGEQDADVTQIAPIVIQCGMKRVAVTM